MADFKSLLGYKDFDTLRQEAFDRLRTAGSKITNLNVGGVFRTLLELAMQASADLHALLLAVAPQGYVQTATGQWLDLKAEELGLTRRQATKTEGVVVFSRQDATAAVWVPAGTTLKTDLSPLGDELRYVVTQDTLIPAAQAEAEVPVRAESAGARYNVGAGMIKHLVTYVTGIDKVENRDGWITLEGADEEDDESLRQRCLLRWNELAQGGTDAAYKSWALAVAGVVDVAVNSRFPRGQGTVDVIITGPEGQPTPTLIDQVQAYIEDRKPNTANVLVKGPTLVSTDITAALTLPANQGDTAAAKALAERRLQALFARDTDLDVEPLRIGEALYRSRLVSLLMAVPDVVNVSLAAPAADVAVAADEMVAAGVITVTVGRAS